MTKAKCINFKCSEIGKVLEIEIVTKDTQPRCKKCGEELIVSKPIEVRKYLISGAVALLLLGIGGASIAEWTKTRNHQDLIDENRTKPIKETIPKLASDIPLVEEKIVTPVKIVPKNIMKVCGSNLINHEVIPILAMNFLKKKGYTNVQQELTDDEHKVLIVGNRGSQQESIEILSDGSIQGYTDLFNKTCDLATSYGEMSKNVASKFNFDIKTEAYEDPFIMDAMTIVVHKNNPLKSLTPHQLRDVFSGKIKNWSEVTNGSKYGDIILYTMSEESGIYHEFVKDLTPDKGGFTISSSHKSFIKHENLESEVALHPNAIGFVSNEHTTNNIKIIPLKEGDYLVFPTPASIISEEYDLFDELYLYSSPESNRLSMTFKAYLDSKEAQTWISENTRLVPMDIITEEEIIEMNQNEKQKRLNNLLVPESYKNYMRPRIETPVVFHFDTGKSNIDHEAYKHILQLKSMLSLDKYKNVSISLIGFSDSGRYRNLTESQDRNAKITLSIKRANQVKSILEGIFPNIKIETKGFGGNEHLLFAPHADSEHERKLDRRVEVWLRINS